MTASTHSHTLRAQEIGEIWNQRATLNPLSHDDSVRAVRSIINELDTGELKVCEKIDDMWHTHIWIKQAILLSFRLNRLELIEMPIHGFDKVPSKFLNWQAQEFEQAGFRVVPGAIVRYGAHISRDVVLMPSFTNVGASIGMGTMIDSYATVGSCAHIGARCHISSSVVIGGVLEPLQANPVIIEDDAFIGAGSCIVEGVHVGQGAVIGMGVQIGASTPIVDRLTGEISYGVIPPYAVVIAGSRIMDQARGLSANCAIIVKRVDAQTRSKTEINALLRF